MSVVIVSMACLFSWNLSFNALLEMLIVVMCLKFLQLYLTCDSHVYQTKLEVWSVIVMCNLFGLKKSSSKLRQSHKLKLFNFFLKKLFSPRAHRDGLSMYCFVFETYLSANLSKESLFKSLKFSAMMVCDIIGSAKWAKKAFLFRLFVEISLVL